MYWSILFTPLVDSVREGMERDGNGKKLEKMDFLRDKPKG